jgi:hypothetical protein
VAQRQVQRKLGKKKGRQTDRHRNRGKEQCFPTTVSLDIVNCSARNREINKFKKNETAKMFEYSAKYGEEFVQNLATMK